MAVDPPANSDVSSTSVPSPAQAHVYPKRALHSKRSFHKHGPGAIGSPVDSPAYDASEEDNEEVDDRESAVAPRRAAANNYGSLKNGSTSKKHHLAVTADEDDPGVDSPTYDGDIESYTTPHTHSSLSAQHERYSSSENTASTLTSPVSRSFALPLATTTDMDNTPLHNTHIAFTPTTPSPLAKGQPRAGDVAKFDPAAITPDEIQEWVRNVISGHSNIGTPARNYKINAPPEGRPVVIYADGVYDLFHYGHALQLRQAKLSFPSVRLLVGVCSDELVRQHKANTIMTHGERCEAIRNCKWVDGVIPEAPWITTSEYLAQHHIDYIAHDEDPYAAPGHDDVYALAKAQGKFLPTRRTPGISTSSLLSRIVAQYRTGGFNSKLEQNGNEELSWKDEASVDG